MLIRTYIFLKVEKFTRFVANNYIICVKCHFSCTLITIYLKGTARGYENYALTARKIFIYLAVLKLMIEGLDEEQDGGKELEQIESPIKEKYLFKIKCLFLLNKRKCLEVK